jgi:hypothetical protein
MKYKCVKDDMVRLFFSLGKCRLKLQAQVRWTMVEGEKTSTGMLFVNPSEDEVKFLTSLFSSVYLR